MKTKDGGPAFHSITCKNFDGFTPAPTLIYHKGMSLRDWFAGQALAILADANVNLTAEELAKCCYQNADAMIAAREVKP